MAKKKTEEKEEEFEIPSKNEPISKGAINVISAREQPPRGLGDKEFKKVIETKSYKTLERCHYDWWYDTNMIYI